MVGVSTVCNPRHTTHGHPHPCFTYRPLLCHRCSHSSLRLGEAFCGKEPKTLFMIVRVCVCACAHVRVSLHGWRVYCVQPTPHHARTPPSPLLCHRCSSLIHLFPSFFVYLFLLARRSRRDTILLISSPSRFLKSEDTACTDKFLRGMTH